MTTSRDPDTPGIDGGHFIAGSWIDGPRPLAVVDPATGEVAARVADATAADAIRALEAAHRAQAAWAAWGSRARAEVLHSAHGLLTARGDHFAELVSAETGKPLTEARGEVALSAHYLRWYAEQVTHLHGTFSDSATGDFRVVVTHKPAGPALLLTAWNFPLLLPVRKLGAALGAGCTAILKPAPETPLTAALLMELLDEAGIPDGVVNMIHTSDPAGVTRTLLADGRVRKVSLTGSTSAGSSVMSAASDRIVSTSLELGGDGPFVVLDDADLDIAVREAIVCKFRNAGQACVAANRIIVDRRIAADFLERFVKAASALRVGPPTEADSEVGPLIAERQLHRLEELLQDLVAAGGTIRTGGTRLDRPGFFFEPTVVSGADPDSDACRAEIFGPLATVFVADSTAHALELANASQYGLSGYVFTQDLSRAVLFSEQLDVGVVGVNRGVTADPSAPFGGVKASGLGREGGHEGIYEFMEPKFIALTIDRDGTT